MQQGRAKNFVRREEAKALSGTAVEPILDRLSSFLRYVTKVHTFRQISAYQAVRVLIRPTLARASRVREVYGQPTKSLFSILIPVIDLCPKLYKRCDNRENI